MVDAVVEKAEAYPGLADVDTDLRLNSPQLDVAVDRDKAAAVGVEIDTLGRTLETLLGGRQVTRFKREGEQYDVVVKISDFDRQNPDDIRRIYVRGREDAMIPLSNLISIKETVAPKELNHFNQLRAATITAQLAPGYSLSDGLEFLEKTSKEVLSGAAHLDYSGQSREFKEASSGMYLTFLLALAFIYLVLAAQFESFTDPFIIMLTVPLSITGALLALWWSGGTLNIYSQVGLVTLIGLITKHGILIVEFSNQLRAKGEPIREAVIEVGDLAAPPDPDDHRRHGARRRAARCRHRRRRREPPGYRLGDRRRAPGRDLLHPVRDPGGLHLSQPARVHRSRPRGHCRPFHAGAARAEARSRRIVTERLPPAAEDARRSRPALDACRDWW